MHFPRNLRQIDEFRWEIEKGICQSYRFTQYITPDVAKNIQHSENMRYFSVYLERNFACTIPNWCPLCTLVWKREKNKLLAINMDCIWLTKTRLCSCACACIMCLSVCVSVWGWVHVSNCESVCEICIFVRFNGNYHGVFQQGSTITDIKLFHQIS